MPSRLLTTEAVELLRSRTYVELKRYVLEHTGLSYYADRNEDLAVRLLRRFSARGIPTAPEYLQLLLHSNEEMDCLVGELTIGETYFFRQPEHFELLRTTIVPAILEQRSFSRKIRIWSAGCATGAEPYSLEILLRTQFENELTGWDVSILATDINVEFLERARHGLFQSWALRETPAHLRAQCFRPEGKSWRLLPEYRKWVRFEYHNLVSDISSCGVGRTFDLILCRNVLIYFSHETIRSVAQKFYGCLHEGGTLLVGHAEPNQENFSMFETVSTPTATLYRKGEVASPNIAERQWLPSLPAPHTPPSQALRPLPDPKPFIAQAPKKSEPAAQPDRTAAPSPVEDILRLADRGSLAPARDAANHLVSVDPLNASAHFTLGIILEQLGEPEPARDSLRRAIYLDRGLVLAHYHLAGVLQNSGDTESATRAFRVVLRLLRLKSPEEPLQHGDGITARELASLALAHLDLLAK